MKILILNYGTSNINSIFNSLKKIKKVKIFVNNFNIKKYDKIILPGQGHIKNSMTFLKSINNLNEYFLNSHILGICIGYHLFFNKSFEDQKVNCLNNINENILLLNKNCCKNTYTPNIGWKKVFLIKKHDIFKNIPLIFKQYFMHSYSSFYKNQNYCYGLSNYNNFLFNSIIIEKNKFLFQFHPEKSGKYGLQILKNFLKL